MGEFMAKKKKATKAKTRKGGKKKGGRKSRPIKKDGGAGTGPPH